MISHDSLWEVIIIIRDFAKWTGNRWEIEIGGVPVTAQRRGRLIVTKGNRKVKTGDTWITSPDHSWTVIARDFNFQSIVMAKDIQRPSGYVDFEKMATARRKVHKDFEQCVIECDGDVERCEKDFVMFKMFASTAVEALAND